MTKLAKLITSAIKKQLARSKSSMASFSSSDDANIIKNNNLRTVLVGKSRRRYLLSSDLLDHPLIRQLLVVDKTTGDDGVAVVVACEVVMFEHLLWMLENSDQSQLASSSMDELVDFYSYR